MQLSNLWIYGDSLSSGTHGRNAYHDALRESFGITELKNFAVGSSGLTETTPNSMVGILKKQENEDLGPAPDVILIWHGTNDWYWGSPLGEAGSTDAATYRGAVRWAVETLRSRYPQALIVWPDSVFRWEKPDGGTEVGDAFSTPNKLGLTLTDYCLALREETLRCHVPMIEMGTRVDMHRWNMEQFTEDHVHPNERGYERIAAVLIREIAAQWKLLHD